MLNRAYGDVAMKRATCFRWYKRFKNGRLSIEDDERSGRPSTSTDDPHIDEINTLVRANRRLIVKPHLHGRLLAAKSTFCLFSFSNRVGHLHGARFKCDFVCAISPDTPTEKSNRSSHSHGRDFNAALAYHCNSQKSHVETACQ